MEIKKTIKYDNTVSKKLKEIKLQTSIKQGKSITEEQLILSYIEAGIKKDLKKL